jgi:hypothetical protein
MTPDNLFAVFEEYGDGFSKFLRYNPDPFDGEYILYIDGQYKIVAWPEIIQEYRKFFSEQNYKP